MKCVGTAWMADVDNATALRRQGEYWLRWTKERRRARTHLVDDGAGVERVEHLVRLLDQEHVQLRHDTARRDTDDEMITRRQWTLRQRGKGGYNGSGEHTCPAPRASTARRHRLPPPQKRWTPPQRPRGRRRWGAARRRARRRGRGRGEQSSPEPTMTKDRRDADKGVNHPGQERGVSERQGDCSPGRGRRSGRGPHAGSWASGAP